METTERLEALRRAGLELADAAELAGPDALVPSCPGWSVRDLVRHTGMVHRWAAAFVTEGHTSYVPDGGEPDLDGDALLDWFRGGHRHLTGALASAPADTECWAFLPAPSPLAFWARRQAHETTVHRVDAQAATGSVGGVGTELAVDGIDELLAGFHARGRSRVRSDLPRTLCIRAVDTADVWTVRITPGPPRTARGTGGEADCELAGPAADLYLALWNRLPYEHLQVAGDADVAALWRRTSAVVW